MTQDESNYTDALFTPDWTEIKVADETSTDDVILTPQSLADRSPVTSPSTLEGADANESELGMVLCIVLAPNTVTDGLIEDSFDVNQDTAPGGPGTFLASWQCTITIGEFGSFCIPIVQPMNETTKYGPIHAESSLHFFAGA